MPTTTRIVGFVLIAIGMIGYLGTGAASITALIPAMVGAVLLILALVARNAEARKHAIHAAVALALPGGASAQQTPTAPQSLAELTRLADDVYLFRYETYQALFIVTDEGVIATDPISLRNPAISTLYKAAIAGVAAAKRQ